MKDIVVVKMHLIIIMGTYNVQYHDQDRSYSLLRAIMITER